MLHGQRRRRRRHFVLRDVSLSFFLANAHSPSMPSSVVGDGILPYCTVWDVHISVLLTPGGGEKQPQPSSAQSPVTTLISVPSPPSFTNTPRAHPREPPVWTSRHVTSPSPPGPKSLWPKKKLNNENKSRISLYFPYFLFSNWSTYAPNEEQITIPPSTRISPITPHPLHGQAHRPIKTGKCVYSDTYTVNTDVNGSSRRCYTSNWLDWLDWLHRARCWRRTRSRSRSGGLLSWVGDDPTCPTYVLCCQGY